MVGGFVMTEHELLKTKTGEGAPSVWALTPVDSHNVQRDITPEGFVQNEGDIWS
jgi:hypothetical protein